MKTFSSLQSFLSAFFQRSQMNNEMEAELRSHIQLRADDLERSGLPRAEAERRARIEFGGMERFKEECHEAAGSQFGERLLQDVRYSLRLLRKSPGFTVAAVLTMALGIGANAVVFAVLNAFIIRPLDVPQADSLYNIQRQSDFSARQSYLDYIDLRDRNRSFDGLAAYSLAQAGIDTGENPSRAWVVEASGNYFDVLRIQPYLGRFFHSSDEQGPNSAPYIVLGHAYWHVHFQDDRGVLGRIVQINKHPFTVIGVAPPQFHGTLLFFSPDFFVPMVNQEQVEGINILNVRGNRLAVFMSMGHLKPGVTTAQAAADVNSISSYLEKTFPNDHGHMTFGLARPSLYGDYLGRPLRAFLGALMVLAGLILLAACANLGNLFGARATDRSREVALRLALGSSRNRILRQLFTEAIMISLAGGALGLWGSVLLLRWLSVWQPFAQFPLNLPVRPDANVYFVALILAVVSGILFGLVPVRQVLKADPYQVVKAGSAGTGGRKRITGRDVLLVAQIAICAVLVTSSLVAVRGLIRSLHSNFGFEPRNAMLVGTGLDMAGYRGQAVPAMQKRMIEAMEKIPGVTSVGLVDLPPLINATGKAMIVFRDEITDMRPANAAATPMTFNVSPEYFGTAGTTLLSGRNFTWHDDPGAPRVAVVNQLFARTMFGSVNDALGRYYKLRDGTRVKVAGVVADGKYGNLTEDPELAMFLPILQFPAGDSWLVVRYTGDTQQLTAAIKGKLRELDPGLPSLVQTWTQALDLVLFPSRVATVALGILGMMGAMLSITGIFGMAAYSVSKRLRELGIRMALGAQNREVLQAALARPFKLLAFGSITGLVLGMLATRVLASIVYQATSRDPLVLAGAVLAMALLGLLATWIPAQRALSVNPLMLLREE